MPYTAYMKKRVLVLLTMCVTIWITATSRMPVLPPKKWVLVMMVLIII